MNYNFGSIEKIIFLGGSELLYKILTQIDNQIEKVVYTSKRFSEEFINDTKFEFFLQKNKIKYYIVDDINSDNTIQNEIIPNKTLGFSISASWIIKQNIIDLFNSKIINIHGARLPLNRGGGGMSWNILQGDKIDGFAFHFITTGIDDGNIILREEFIFPEKCKKPIDFDKYKNIKILDSTIHLIKKICDKKSFQIITQQNEFSSYWPRLFTNVHGYINWDWSLYDIEKFINAFDEPYSGAITFINGKKVIVKNVFIQKSDGTFHPFQKGIIFRKNNIGFFIATELGTLVIQSITDEKKIELYDSINPGDRLYTPKEKIEEAFSTRVFYDANGLKIKKDN